MDKQEQKQKEERKAFDMAKQDILFLKDLELVTHNDKPDFVLKDKIGRKIGLEHFRADVYRVQDENSSHISGGHTVLNDSKDALFQKYNPIAVSDAWTDDILKQSADDLFGGHMRRMNVHETLKEVEETCNQYNFWDRMIHPYGFGIRVDRIFSNWKDYDLCTDDSKSVIRSEIRGFLPILAKWVEYKHEPLVKVKLTEGKYAGQVKKYNKSIAELIIENGSGVAV